MKMKNNQIIVSYIIFMFLGADRPIDLFHFATTFRGLMHASELVTLGDAGNFCGGEKKIPQTYGKIIFSSF